MKKTSVLEVMTEIRDLLLLQKDIFTISEVCSYTGFEKSYIYKLTSLRKIPHFKSPGGKNIFFKRSEINDWLTQIKIKTIDEINLEANKSTSFLKSKK
ncbi:helix-turn-helix domain-containing protein [Flavobacterium sp.]|uniref:helix-turn-helix transcriptional regulator n=1 Tax=Flavobacterium sp. TaxID=239 RepID=UPI002625A31F|nr:helix-turn-helix domain-containing protein [Flavobacterium sp.]